MARWLATLALGAAAPTASGDDHFTARFGADLATVEARLCFDGAAPDRIYRSSRAARFASPIQSDGKRLQVRERGTRVYLPRDLPENACLDWTVDLGRAAAGNDYRTALRVGDSLLATTQLWFWKGPWRRPLVASVELPEGFVFSTPWPRDPDRPDRYRPVRTPSSWTTKSAVGRFEQRTLEVPGAHIHLSLLGTPGAAEADKLTRWIRRSVDAVTPVFGHFPRDAVQVVVVPIGPRSEPVPWAHVVRGGGPSVQFYVDETRPLAEFDADWTATHEFSHLLMPFVARDDRWLSEGMASYYQNVLRARDGRLSEREAWQALHAGFQRGQNATRPETLEAAMEQGWGSTMRVYWTGAAMMLQADMALRARGDGAQSLDMALERFMDCCFEEGRRWRAREVLEQLDRLTGTDVFMSVYRDNMDRLAFPDVDDAFDALGLGTRGDRLWLEEDAPLAGVRRDIMAPPGDNPRDRAADNAP